MQKIVSKQKLEEKERLKETVQLGWEAEAIKKRKAEMEAERLVVRPHWEGVVTAQVTVTRRRWEYEAVGIGVSVRRWFTPRRNEPPAAVRGVVMTGMPSEVTYWANTRIKKEDTACIILSQSTAFFFFFLAFSLVYLLVFFQPQIILHVLRLHMICTRLWIEELLQVLSICVSNGLRCFFDT